MMYSIIKVNNLVVTVTSDCMYLCLLLIMNAVNKERYLTFLQQLSFGAWCLCISTRLHGVTFQRVYYQEKSGFSQRQHNYPTFSFQWAMGEIILCITISHNFFSCPVFSNLLFYVCIPKLHGNGIQSQISVWRTEHICCSMYMYTVKQRYKSAVTQDW
jgi:hypothetical protein